MEDKYLTISAKSKGIYKEKGSKFIAFAYPVFSEEEFKACIQELKKEFHDARHHCYAFRFGVKKDVYRYSDDGEPSSTAGKPIFGQIQSFDLTNIGIIVVRYFGGTKLGVGGLIHAYREAAKDAIENAQIIERTVDDFFSLNFGYEIMSDVMNKVKALPIDITTQEFNEEGYIEFHVRKNDSDRVIEALEAINGLKVNFIRTA